MAMQGNAMAASKIVSVIFKGLFFVSKNFCGGPLDARRMPGYFMG
jgi:hypothetical protein